MAWPWSQPSALSALAILPGMEKHRDLENQIEQATNQENELISKDGYMLYEACGVAEAKNDGAKVGHSVSGDTGLHARFANFPDESANSARRRQQ